MSGATSRRKGHETERIVARWLREHGFSDACTTRSKLGSDGTRTPGDVDFHPLIVCEVKFVESSSRWPTWCRQAAAEAPPGTVPVVVRRTRGVTDVGQWECRVMWPAWLLAAGDLPLPGARTKVDLYTWKVLPFGYLVAAVRALDTEGGAVTDDLTERLRALSATEIVDADDGERSIRVRTNEELREVGDEAADRIDSLTAERDALRSLLVDVSFHLGQLSVYAEDWAPRDEERLTECRARVREALGGES